MEVTRISTNDTAKMIRQTLKNSFPATKFSVRGHKYAGGSSINIYWTDGPLQKDVDSIVKLYEGASFDGMTDSKSYHNSFVILEGSTLPVQVHYGADFVFTNRDLSPEFKAELVKKFEEITGEKYDDNTIYSTDRFDLYQMPRMYGCQIINHLFHNAVRIEKVGA